MAGKTAVFYLEDSSLAWAAARRLKGTFPAKPLSATSLGKDGVSGIVLGDLRHSKKQTLRRIARDRRGFRLILLYSGKAPESLNGFPCYACLPSNASRAVLERTVRGALEHLALARSARTAREDRERRTRELEELNRIGVALSETRDVSDLLSLILAKARLVACADAGSLYIVEQRPAEADGSPGAQLLRFMLTQNDSVQFPYSEHTLPLTEDSIAGYCALHGEVVQLRDAQRIPRGQPYAFNASFDERTGYVTRSLLAVPLKNGKGQVLGVLELLNCKREPKARLRSRADVDRFVRRFPERAVRLILSLASQAAVAYENSRLYHDIETLFEGFVKAAVTAIEQRDPTTSGHSLRVTTMTCGLAEAVDRTPQGPYGDARFSREQMKELRYATLLHDFGKVGVREEVLVKAKKLYPLQLARIEDRFDYIRRDLEAQIEKQKVDLLLTLPRDEARERVRALDEEFKRLLAELEDHAQFIRQANEPTILPAGEFEKLREVAARTYRDPRGVERSWLTADEVRFLSIPRGSLDPEERRQIESHVVHSFNFLMQIPWTGDLLRVPHIARAHHEKLNGTGYPYRLREEQIPVQAKMMTICDIFDALTAADRPYKRAVPAERALDMLRRSVEERELDAELFRLFLEARVYELATKSS
jgi:HD-GYP domain-containing protein (c-di-GMP phosphodiesterase class II)